MSALASIDPQSAVGATRRSLGLATVGENFDRVLIAQSLRRAVFISAPCTYRVARDLVADALGPLSQRDRLVLAEDIDQALDDLVAVGDILEMRGAESGGCSLRPAPPAFVSRRDGSFIVLGVAGDEIDPSLSFPITHLSSGLRFIGSSPDPTITRQALLEAGLVDLAERTWMRAPKTAPAISYLSDWVNKLPSISAPERIEGLEVLAKGPSTFYKSRWAALSKDHSGTFVARRPQKYGANLWSFVEVQGGLVQRLVDIHGKDSRTRSCDEAWRLQSAIDSSRGTPQFVTVQKAGELSRLSFSSPIPMWAVRRLAIVGEQTNAPGALLTFSMASSHAYEEAKWLGESLWLESRQGGTG